MVRGSRGTGPARWSSLFLGAGRTSYPLPFPEDSRLGDLGLMLHFSPGLSQCREGGVWGLQAKLEEAGRRRTPTLAPVSWPILGRLCGMGLGGVRHLPKTSPLVTQPHIVAPVTGGDRAGLAVLAMRVTPQL